MTPTMLLTDVRDHILCHQHLYSSGINESLTMIFVVTWITLNLRSDLSSSSSSKNRFAISSPTSARPRLSISLNPINHIRAIFLMSETSPSNEMMLPSRYFKKESSLIKSLLKIPGYFKWFISEQNLKNHLISIQTWLLIETATFSIAFAQYFKASLFDLFLHPGIPGTHSVQDICFLFDAFYSWIPCLK